MIINQQPYNIINYINKKIVKNKQKKKYKI